YPVGFFSVRSVSSRCRGDSGLVLGAGSFSIMVERSTSAHDSERSNRSEPGADAAICRVGGARRDVTRADKRYRGETTGRSPRRGQQRGEAPRPWTLPNDNAGPSPRLELWKATARPAQCWTPPGP